LHNEYEKTVVERCCSELLPRWQNRMADSENVFAGQLLDNDGKYHRHASAA